LNFLENVKLLPLRHLLPFCEREEAPPLRFTFALRSCGRPRTLPSLPSSMDVLFFFSAICETARVKELVPKRRLPRCFPIFQRLRLIPPRKLSPSPSCFGATRLRSFWFLRTSPSFLELTAVERKVQSESRPCTSFFAVEHEFEAHRVHMAERVASPRPPPFSVTEYHFCILLPVLS